MLKTFLIPLVKSYAPNAIRHVSQAAAGALVTYGITSGADAELVGGAILTVLTVTWSVVEKKGLLNKLFA